MYFHAKICKRLPVAAWFPALLMTFNFDVHCTLNKLQVLHNMFLYFCACAQWTHLIYPFSTIVHHYQTYEPLRSLRYWWSTWQQHYCSHLYGFRTPTLLLVRDVRDIFHEIVWIIGKLSSTSLKNLHRPPPDVLSVTSGYEPWMNIDILHRFISYDFDSQCNGRL